MRKHRETPKLEMARNAVTIVQTIGLLSKEYEQVSNLNSPPDCEWGVSVNWFLGRRLWEMKSRVEWQESGVECPLVELMGTSARYCDRAPPPS